MGDEFPEVKVGDWVQARVAISDEDVEVAVPGDVGHIIDKRPGFLPTVAWDRTRRVYDCDPVEELAVLCDYDFAKDEPHTPSRPRRDMLKRGKA